MLDKNFKQQQQFSVTNYGSDEEFLKDWGINDNYNIVNIRSLQIKSLNLLRTNSIAGTIFNVYHDGVIDDGLTLELTPETDLINLSGDEVDDIRSQIMAKWRVFSKRKVTKDKRFNFDEITSAIFMSTMVSGDCVVIFEIDNKGDPTIQAIDGLFLNSSFLPQKTENGNNVIDGVEYNALTGEIEAFYFTDNSFKPFRFPAKTPRGRRRAFLVRSHASKFIADLRGTPILAPVIQNIYEAGRSIAAEQRAAYINSTLAVIHTKADGQNIDRGAEAFTDKILNNDVVSSTDGKFKRAELNIGMIKANLNAGETIQSFDTKRPNISMTEFINTITDMTFRASLIPPEVGNMKFGSNYSASRQATMIWNKNCKNVTKLFSNQWANEYVALWLDTKILRGEIKCESYRKALINNDIDTLGAWRSAEWVGSADRNVDVLKQAKAFEIYNDRGWATSEQVTKALGYGDFWTNAQNRKKEEEFYIPPSQRQATAVTTDQPEDEGVNDLDKE